MNRRSFLRASVLPGALGFAGCLSKEALVSGVNEALVLRNDYREPVAIRVTVRLDDPPGSGNPETVFEDAVTVPTGEETVLEELGDAQYEVSVQARGRSRSFRTRPICDRAHTRVLVTESGELTEDVRSCE